MFFGIKCLLLFVTELALSHVLNYDSVTVCDGMAKQIQCPGKENIHVLQGFFGKWRNRNCKGDAPDPENYPTCRIPRGRVTAIVKQLCQGQNTCKLISDKSIYGNPCPRTKPYLYVTFFCMAPGQKLNHQKTKFNEEVVTVPSHGFVVSETRHHLEEEVADEEKSNQGLFRETIPSGNPRVENLSPRVTDKVEAKIIQRRLETQVEPQKSLSITRNIMQKPESSITPDITQKIESSVARDNLHKPEATSDTDAWDRSKINTVSENNDLRIDGEGQVQSVFHSDAKVNKDHRELENEEIGQTTTPLKTQNDDAEESNQKRESLKYATTPSDYQKFEKTLENDSSHPSTFSLSQIRSFKRLDSNKKQQNLESQNDALISPLKTQNRFKSEEPVKSSRAAMICNGQSKLIACLPEEVIKVVHAFYGKRSGESCLGPLAYKDEAPTCSALDARANVQASCDGKQTCLLFADDNIYGKSLCPNVNKYLHLRYTCNEVTKAPSSKGLNLIPQVEAEENAVVRSIKTNDNRYNQTISLCNGERRVLKCETNDGIKIRNVFYGKKVGKDCKGDLGYRDDIPECFSTRASDIVKLICEKKRSCEIESDSAMFEDELCPGVNKYLEVQYTC